MSRTYKNEHKTDGWHVGRRLERRARPAGRMRAILEAEGLDLSGCRGTRQLGNLEDELVELHGPARR